MANKDLSISRELVRVRYEFGDESGAPIMTRAKDLRVLIVGAPQD